MKTKNLILLAITILTCFSCKKDKKSEEDNSSCIPIPDEIFKNYLLNNSQINTNSDDCITENEATSFNGTIEVNNISDITGIEYFTSLSILRIDGFTDSIFDVSNNFSLSILDCVNGNINTLNLPAKSTLTSLNCSHNNLENLDLSSHVSLERLICVNNSIISLDASNNPSLHMLYCDNNSLTSLNIKNGNNTNMETTSTDYQGMSNKFATFSAAGNLNLTCITVDDTTWSNQHWGATWYQFYDIKMSQVGSAIFSHNCP